MANYCTHSFRRIINTYNWRNGSTIRSYRFRCKCCGYRWNVYYDKKLKREVVPTHKSDNKPLETRKLTPEEVKLILTDKRDNVKLARLLGVVPQSVSQIRTGRAYKDLWPELPRRAAQVKALGSVPTIRSTKITCRDCAHWWQKRCSLEVPEAGGTFAIECSFYQVDE